VGFYPDVANKLTVCPVASSSELPAPTKATIDALLPDLIASDTSSNDYNAAYLERHSHSPSHIYASARGQLEVQKAVSSETLPETSADSILSVLDRLTESDVPPNVTVFEQAMELLVEIKADKSKVDDFRQRCNGRAPLAYAFMSEEERRRRKQRQEDGVTNGHVDGKSDV
jgi:hypothetical protein